MSATPRPGTISWQDLTVEDAEQVRDFYAAVVGWKPEGQSMGTYPEFDMRSAAGVKAAGLCQARAGNSDLPAQWLIYITVDEVDHSMEECGRLGGALVTPPRSYGGGRYCVIKDPAGAVCALYQPPDAA